MSHPFRISLLILLLGTFLWSCTKETDLSNRALTYLPGDTDAVMVIRSGQLLEKANWATIQASEPFAEMLAEVAEEEPNIAAILRDPEVSGLDMTANAFFAGVVPFADEREPKIILAFPVADAAKLAEQVANLEEGAQTVDNNSWSQGKISLAWNEDVLLIVNSPDDSISASQLLEKSTDNLSGDADMQDFLARDFDLGWWMNSGLIAQYLPDEALELLPGWSREDLRGNYLHGTWRFDQGEMVGEFHPVLSRRLAADIDLLFRSETELDLSAGLPTEGLLAVFTAACDLPGIDQLLLEYMVEGGAREELKTQGIDYEGILASLSGDVLMGFYENSLFPDALFVAGLKDSDHFQEILANSPKVNAVGEGWYELLYVTTQYGEDGEEISQDTTAGTYLRVLEDRFVIADTREAVEQYGTEAPESAVVQQFRELRPGHRFVAVWDPNAMVDEGELPAGTFGISYAFADDNSVVNHWILEDKSINSLELLMRLMAREKSEKDPTSM
jgi:hypothetical protein